MYLHMCCVAVADPVGDDDDLACLVGSHNFRAKIINVTRGDYSEVMKRLVENLQLAKVCEQLIIFRTFLDLCD